jgi:hypothetical protein
MKIIIFAIVISFNLLNAQVSQPFSKFDVGFYSGKNFHNIENLGSEFFIEFKANISPSVKLKILTGYSVSIQPYSYTVKKYSENAFNDSIPIFFATKYDILYKKYDAFPISLGIQYYFLDDNILPYISVEAVYNFLNTVLESSPPEIWSYNSIDEIPFEFKGIQKSEYLPKKSYGIILGTGIAYSLNSKLNLDFRYFFKYDNTIINTHHFIIGIYF